LSSFKVKLCFRRKSNQL